MCVCVRTFEAHIQAYKTGYTFHTMEYIYCETMRTENVTLQDEWAGTLIMRFKGLINSKCWS